MKIQHAPLKTLAEKNKEVMKVLEKPTVGFSEFCLEVDKRFPSFPVKAMDPTYLLGRWRYTQGVYALDPLIEKELLKSDKGEIPTEALRYLPEWAVYISTRAVPSLEGFFFTFSEDGEWGNTLLFLLIWKDGVEQNFALEARETLHESLEVATLYGNRGVDVDRKAISQLLSRLFNLVLYLCSKNREIGPKAPNKPIPKKTKKGTRYLVPSHPRMWEVAFRKGADLRRKLKQVSDLEVEGSTTGRKNRPHICRAHFRWQACGKAWKDHELRWIDPQFRGFRDSGIQPGEQPAVQRDVPPAN